jgi:hypothetical protein
MLSHIPHKRAFFLFPLSVIGLATWGSHFRGAVKAAKSRFLSLAEGETVKREDSLHATLV